jgi:hypothetical protein
MLGGLVRVLRPEMQRRRQGPVRLLRRFLCANLVFYAVVRAERKCVRAHRGMDRYFGHPDWFHLGWFSEWVPRGWAGVAQLVEHLICNQRVGGSNPFASSTRGSLNRGLRSKN